MGNVKNNIRSFRYSDDIEEILDSMEGKNLNDKFDNLVRTCYLRLPEIRKKIDMYEGFLQDHKEKYFKMLSMEKELSQFIYQVGQMQDKLEYMKGKLDTVCNTIFLENQV